MMPHALRAAPRYRSSRGTAKRSCIRASPLAHMAARSEYAIPIFSFDVATSRSVRSAARLTEAVESFAAGAANAAEPGRTSEAVRANAPTQARILHKPDIIDTPPSTQLVHRPPRRVAE